MRARDFEQSLLGISLGAQLIGSLIFQYYRINSTIVDIRVRTIITLRNMVSEIFLMRNIPRIIPRIIIGISVKLKSRV